MATLRAFLHALLLFLNFSFLTNAQTASLSSYFPDLRPRASSTTTALDCSQTTTANVSACYPNLNLIPTCCRPCLINVTLQQPCASTDFRCLCAHSSDIQIRTLRCMNGTCSTEDEQTAVNYYYSYCQGMNYSLSVVPSSSTFTATTQNPAPTSPTTNATATVTTTPSASPSKNTILSPATGAGIGITFAGILLIAATTIFCVRRHHVHRQQATVGTRLPGDVGVAADRKASGPTPNYPTRQEIDGETVNNIALRERPPEPPAGAAICYVSDSSNVSPLNETPTARTLYEMDGRRPWS